MVDHGARDHATWSASATARNWQCAGALALAQTAPPDKESEHAARGTAAHQVAEKCLRSGKDAIAYLETVEKTKSHDIEIDEEIVNSAQVYVDYCRSLMAEPGAQWWIEERFTFDALGTPFDAGGTGDFVCYIPVDYMLVIVDLKNGMGVVEVENNPQPRSYGLGALLSHQNLKVRYIRSVIVQPRAPHKNGVIRAETIHVADLLSWSSQLLQAMGRSKQALDEHEAAGANSVLLDEWRDKWLSPGKCTFCPVEGSCPALRRDALSVASVWFDDGQPKIGNAALDTSPEVLGRDLDMIPMLEDWIKARRAYAHAQAEAGLQIPGYQLSDRIGNRRWIGDEKEAAAKIIEATGMEPEQVYEWKLRTPAQIEKALGGKKKLLVEPFIERPVRGTNLVSVAKSSRPAAKSVAEKYFQP